MGDAGDWAEGSPPLLTGATGARKGYFSGLQISIKSSLLLRRLPTLFELVEIREPEKERIDLLLGVPIGEWKLRSA